MGQAKFRPERVPKPAFVSLEQIKRHTRMLLGLPIDKVRAEIPWGYSLAEGETKKLVPNERALRLLVKAKEYLRTCSLGEVAKWLTAETQIPVSTEGLRVILTQRCPFDEILLEQDERERLFNS